MLDPNLLRKRDENAVRGLSKRGVVVDWEEFDRLDSSKSDLQEKCQNLRAERNSVASEIGRSKGNDEKLALLMERGAALAENIGALEQEEKKAIRQVEDFCLRIPNLPDEDVPFGSGDTDNVTLRSEKEKTSFEFTPKEHMDLVEGLNASRQDFASKIAGSRFCLLAGQVVKLQRAIEGLMLDSHAKAGYTELYVPLLVNAEAMRGTGQLPKFEEELFKTTDGRYLIPTAEVPITNIFAGEMLDADELPLKFCAKTPCFRSEAGSAGKDTKGLIRQHQFEKVELVRFERAEASAAAHEEMLADAEAILKSLDLPYRVVLLCGGDLGFSAAKTYDIEVWLPGQNAYREISSVSNFKDFQARRMGLRAKDKNGKRAPVHTLNGSGLAVGRTLVAVLENYQDELGRIKIPSALVDRMGGLEWLEKESLGWGKARQKVQSAPKNMAP